MKKPGKKATKEQLAAYRKALKARVGAVQARRELEQLREDADAAGAAARTIIATLDGGFRSKVFLKEPMRGIEVLVRAAKNTVLCGRAGPEEVSRFYSRRKFTPADVLGDDAIPWCPATVRTGGRQHAIRLLRHQIPQCPRTLPRSPWNRHAVSNGASAGCMRIRKDDSQVMIGAD